MSDKAGNQMCIGFKHLHKLSPSTRAMKDDRTMNPSSKIKLPTENGLL